MLAKVFSAAHMGIDAYLVEVEVDIFWGLPGVHLVGLPDTAVQESRERVRSAIKNSGFDFPGQRITINMAPANTRKSGPVFDLAIALGMLLASEQILSSRHLNTVIIGELSLDGSIRPIHGTLAFAQAAREAGKQHILLPAQNAAEAALIAEVQAYPVKTLREAAAWLCNQQNIEPTPFQIRPSAGRQRSLDYAHVKGQSYAKRGLEIAAAGGHNALMIGPPGSGKTMLAQRLPSILPPLNFEEALEATRIHSIHGLLHAETTLIQERPFRAPHHSISCSGLIGGSSMPRPGEVSLAHHGVLFLDELLEFRRSALEMLRQPLEDRRVTISRAQTSLVFPASFMLIASMNPCPCGFYSDPEQACRCTPRQRERYWHKLSGPILERIDVHLEVPRLNHRDLLRHTEAESSEQIQKRVLSARKRQEQRFKSDKLFFNAQMSPELVKKHCRLDAESLKLMEQTLKRFYLSARSFDRILKMARTIADLADSTEIQTLHLAEAVQFRVQGWQ